MILKGLSTVQYNDQAGKILSQGAAATQGRISVALNTRKKLSVTLANLKVEADARLEDSMPPLPQATGEALRDGPLWDKANSRPSLEDDGNKQHACHPKQENSGVGGPTFNKLLATRDGEDAGLRRAQRHTALQRAPK